MDVQENKPGKLEAADENGTGETVSDKDEQKTPSASLANTSCQPRQTGPISGPARAESLAKGREKGGDHSEIGHQGGGKERDGHFFDVARQRRKAVIKRKAIKFSKVVSLVGLRHAVDQASTRVRKSIWALWILFGCGLALYQIAERLVYYYQYPFNTEFRVENAESLPFPQVTICKQNPIMKQKLYESDLRTAIEDIRNLIQKRTDGVNVSAAEEESLKNRTLNWNERMEDLSEPLNDCAIAEFGGSRLSGKRIATDRGYCIAYGSDNSLPATKHGMRSGLKVILTCNEKDYEHYMTITQDALSGYRVLIHDPVEIPRMFDDAFIVSYGSAAQISITFENITYLNRPRSACSENSTYRFSNCIAEWEEKVISQNLSCKLLHGKGNGNNCSYWEHVASNFLIQKVRSNQNKTDKDLYDELQSCIPQCHRQLYKYSVTQSVISETFITETLPAMLRALPQTDGPGDRNDTGVTILYIYYPHFMFTEVKAVASYSFLALLCDIGGALSLLLGATLLTLYEVAEFIVLLVRDYIRYKRVKTLL